MTPCGVGTRHAGMEQVSEGETKRNKKKELTKSRRQTRAVASVDEGWGRGMGDEQVPGVSNARKARVSRGRQ